MGTEASSKVTLDTRGWAGARCPKLWALAPGLTPVAPEQPLGPPEHILAFESLVSCPASVPNLSSSSWSQGPTGCELAKGR